MRAYDYNFLIDGEPILVPDADIAVSFEDLDSSESGRDESGVMHRIVLREGMRKIPLSYGFLKAEEYRYMESLFKGRSHFEVEIIGLDGDSTKFDAYRSKHSITIRNIRTGLYTNYNFNIIEC